MLLRLIRISLFGKTDEVSKDHHTLSLHRELMPQPDG